MIVQKNDLLVFCEVKTRKTEAFGKPFEAINEEKQKRIRRMAEGFIASRYLKFSFLRFDAVSILVGVKTEINLIENAF